MFTHEKFTQLVQRYIDTVFRIALNYTKNPTDAEDIVQNVFLKLYAEKKEFQSDEHIRNWLLRVVVNEGKKYVRSPWRDTSSYEEYISSVPFPSPEHRELFAAVMALPKKFRLPIYLHYYEDYSTREIADILRIPHGTVCTNLSRGRALLREQLQEVESYEE